ncbi:hypothetical protein RCL1_007335 [Eukaryota sp. TZLM3-RCL]
MTATCSDDILLQHIEYLKKFSKLVPSLAKPTSTVTAHSTPVKTTRSSTKPDLSSLAAPAALPKVQESSVSTDELKERLRKKIEEARLVKKGQPEKQENTRKRRTKSEVAVKKPRIEENVDIQLPQFQTPTDDPVPSSSVPSSKPLPALKRKKMLLEQLESEKKALSELPTEVAINVKQNKLWESTLSRAQGNKVLDDTSRIRQSIKREEKQKQRSKKQWEVRNKAVQEQKEAKQERRRSNIESRKIAKKGGKAAPKPVKRPGFEGRRDKAITKKK